MKNPTNIPPLTQNAIKAFEFRAQAIFSLLEKKHPLVLHYGHSRNLNITKT
jgi:hypothetical protein